MNGQEYSRLDDQWPQLIDLLKEGNGTEARNLLRDALHKDIKLFNGLYWRVNKWLLTRIMIKGMSESEQEKAGSTEACGKLRLSAFLLRIKGTDEWWNTGDLPRILSEIDGEALRCSNGK